jgi:hypothetical protein
MELDPEAKSACPLYAVILTLSGTKGEESPYSALPPLPSGQTIGASSALIGVKLLAAA